MRSKATGVLFHVFDDCVLCGFGAVRMSLSESAAMRWRGASPIYY